MPTEEEETKILIIRHDGKVVTPFEATQEQAEAIEVQDHGDLIDAHGKIQVSVVFTPEGKCQADLTAPTVISASRKAEGRS